MNNKDRALSLAEDALRWSYDYFLLRDMMNAQVHCSPLRKSEITERIFRVLDEVVSARLNRLPKECDITGYPINSNGEEA